MLRIDRDARTFRRLEEPELAEREIWERQDLQRMIWNSPSAFFEEVGEQLLLIGEEICPSDVVEDRIDLLALDAEGAAVIIELKRGNHKLQLLQALAYAGMVSKWEVKDFTVALARSVGRQDPEVQDQLEEFLGSGSPSDVNRSQRVILVAENFDYGVLATAEWLNEKYGVDIRCYRLQLSQDGEALFLSCSCVYPPPELSTVAARRRKAAVTGERNGWADWNEAIAAMENPAMAEFYRSHIPLARRSLLSRRILRFRPGRVPLGIVARRRFAYVWQRCRFREDIRFWSSRLGADAEVQEIRSGAGLRFFLTSAEQFKAFGNALAGELAHAEIMEPEDDDPETGE